MRKYIFIAIGGMLGAILRYFIKGIHIYHYEGIMPINTFLINILGSFLLALILTISFEIYEVDADLKLGIATGLLGAYTTFSTLCKETVNLMSQGYYYSSLSYIGFSTIFGLSTAYFGVLLARKVVSKFVHHQSDSDDAELEDTKEVIKWPMR